MWRIEITDQKTPIEWKRIANLFAIFQLKILTFQSSATKASDVVCE